MVRGPGHEGLRHDNRSEAYKFAYGVTETTLKAVMRPVSARGHAVTALWRAKERLRDKPRVFAAAKQVFGPLTGRNVTGSKGSGAT